MPLVFRSLLSSFIFCLVVDLFQSFTHILQGCFPGTGAIIQASLKDMGKIYQYQKTAKHEPYAYKFGEYSKLHLSQGTI